MTLEIQNLSFSYGTHPILKNLSFRREGGGLTALLGENGSGKSTLLAALAGLRSRDGIFWNGRPLDEWTSGEQARFRALVPQHPRYDPTMTLYDYVFLGRKPWFRWKESTRDRDIVSREIDRFNLGKLAFRSLSQISGGERQKAMLARAFAQDTPLLLLDEPLNNLDLRFRIEFMNALKQRASDGTLVIVALHDVNAALSWCHSAILMKDGAIITEGPAAQALTRESLRHMLGVEAHFYTVDGHRQMAAHRIIH